uniref:Uncharacterized protein n=1 Tax=Avena sativa TaxID=4498 RepID=A0ACD5X438_AVESA
MQLSPMRCLMPSSARRRQQCPLLAAFCASLVDGLARLDSALSSSSAVSIRWCVDAMRLVRRMQGDLLAVFRSADAPVAAADCPGGGGAGSSDCWLEQYMQETAALLDLCNALKSAVARMHRYCMVVNFAAQVHGCRAGATAASLVAAGAAAAEETDAPSYASAVRGKLSDVRAVVSEAERLGRKILSGGGGSSVVLVTLVAKITMAVVATSVLHALSHTSPPSPLDHEDNVGAHQRGSSTLARAAVPEQLRPWRESLSAINDRVTALPASIAEHENVATAVRDMVGGKTEGSEDHVELLRARSGELREGVEMFDCVLDQVFDEVIRGRNEMLGIFRDKALT